MVIYDPSLNLPGSLFSPEEQAPPQDDPSVKKIKHWRHKIQRIFLSLPSVKSEDTASADRVFGEIEGYDGFTAENLSSSKIGKVMRRVRDLPDGQIPHDDLFNFRGRAKMLVKKWDSLPKRPLEPAVSYADQFYVASSSATEDADKSAAIDNSTASTSVEDCKDPQAAKAEVSRPLPTPPVARTPSAPTPTSPGSSSIHVPEYRKENIPREPSELDDDPEAQRVRYWRNFLQKKFLTPGHEFQPKDSLACDSLLTTIEEYEGMTDAYLTYSKIPKVLRYISLLSDEQVPGDEEFHFRERSTKLFMKWRARFIPEAVSADTASPPDDGILETPIPPSPPVPAIASPPGSSGHALSTTEYTDVVESCTRSEDSPSNTTGVGLDATPNHPTRAMPEEIADPTSLNTTNPPTDTTHRSQCKQVVDESRDVEDIPETEELDVHSETSGSHVDIGEVIDDDASDEYFDASPPLAEEDEAWVLVDMIMESVRVA